MRTVLDRLVHLICAGLAISITLASQAAEPPLSQVEAVWKPQRVDFEYRSEGRLYRCHHLEYKIRTILHRLGARERIEMSKHSCHDLGRFARFELLIESPVEATEQNLRELPKHDSKDELIALVRNVPIPSAADLQRFPAVWLPISFRHDVLDLDSGDCALVQQLRRQIMPLMSVEVTKDINGADCSQELTGISKPRLTVVALVASEVH